MFGSLALALVAVQKVAGAFLITIRPDGDIIALLADQYIVIERLAADNGGELAEGSAEVILDVTSFVFGHY